MGTQTEKLEAALDEPRDAPTRRLKQALRAFEQGLGGRDALIEILAEAPSTSPEEAFLIQLADPQNDEKTLGQVICDAGMTAGKFFRFLSSAERAKHMRDAMGNVLKGLPSVTQDLVARSVPRKRKCRKCGGLGTITKLATGASLPEIIQCTRCEGAGQVEVEPDIKRQELVLKVAGLLQPQGPLVQMTKNNMAIDARTQQLQVNHHALDAGFTRTFLAASDQVLFGRRVVKKEEPELVEAKIMEEVISVEEQSVPPHSD